MSCLTQVENAILNVCVQKTLISKFMFHLVFEQSVKFRIKMVFLEGMLVGIQMELKRSHQHPFWTKKHVYYVVQSLSKSDIFLSPVKLIDFPSIHISVLQSYPNYDGTKEICIFPEIFRVVKFASLPLVSSLLGFIRHHVYSPGSVPPSLCDKTESIHTSEWRMSPSQSNFDNCHGFVVILFYFLYGK